MLHKDCGDANEYCKSGYSKYCKKDYQGALEDFTKAIEMKPSCGAAFHNRGLIFLYLNRTIEAIMDFAHAKELGYPVDPNDLNILN